MCVSHGAASLVEETGAGSMNAETIVIGLASAVVGAGLNQAWTTYREWNFGDSALKSREPSKCTATEILSQTSRF